MNNPSRSWRSLLSSMALMMFSVTACGGGGDGTNAKPAAKKLSTQDATRLAEQSSFGATPESVAAIEMQALDDYLDSQFAAPTSNYAGFFYVPPQPKPECTAAGDTFLVSSLPRRAIFGVSPVPTGHRIRVEG